MKTIGNPTLQRCFDAMNKNTPVLLCEQRKEDEFFADTQTIEYIDRNGQLAIYDEIFGVVYEVNLSDILIITEQ